MDRAALEARYAAALRAALAEDGTSAPPAWMQPRLPAAIGASMLAAQELLGEVPAPLAAHYLERAPRELVDQQLRGQGEGDPARALLWRPLVRARVPAFARAVDGVCELLRECAIDPARVIGAASSEALLAGEPCAVQLMQLALLASGLPFLGAGLAERGAIASALASPDADLDRVFDHHLGQHLLHELLHGRAANPTDPYDLDGPPWFVREAAALWLQSRAAPRHIFPAVAGEAIPGVSLFVLAGEGFAAALGARTLLSALLEPAAWRESAPAPVVEWLARAEWQEWLPRKDAPFARDALRAEAWVKLAWLAISSNPISAELPSLLDEAERMPWPESAWWRREIEPGDRVRLETALRALFQENGMAQIFVTRPAPIPGGVIFIDVERCRAEVAARASGVFGEPARWVVPPPICRALFARGVRKIELRSARLEQLPMLAAALVAIARDPSPAADAMLRLDAAVLVETFEKASGEAFERASGRSEARWTSSPT